MELSEYCESLAKACEDAGNWVGRNEDVVRNEKEGLLKELRRAKRSFKRCARASSRKMCAGVFGPSQAGKSYLISALARDENNNLNALFGNESHDFISEINPEGGKESTGLVTRFTMTRPRDLPDGFPVRVRLLSETDIVKIIANTYFADCELKEDPGSDIKATLKTLSGRQGKGECVIGLDEMEDLREYLARDFRSKARVQELENKYWEQALVLGPKLYLEDRIRLYSLIWDEVEEFTRLLRTLLNALSSLGYAENAYCPLSALIPRETSIIDVNTLEGVNDPKSAPLDIVTPKGIRTSLPRSVIAALVAELTIVMEEKPAKYFDYTDLLDFPGYRSRYKFDDVRKELKKTGMLKEMFLRGKVAYLFQRYSAENELTSMLLCIGPSNQEVQDLPGVINSWIAVTHGEKPEDRVGKLVSLFLILTKFDLEFEDKKGAPTLETRWDNRLHASLLDFFGKQHDWPTQWTPGQGFNNIFFLRNPNFRFDSVMDYVGDKEKGVRPQRVEYVKKLHEAFMHGQLVREHIKDPARAWNEAMRLNDGGISYIRESLSPLCDPQIKIRQLLGNVNETREAIARRLAPFWQSDDKEELRRQKLLLIRNLFAKLGQLEASQQRLGQLLRGFTVDDADIFDLHQEASRRYLDMNDQEDSQEAPPEILQVDVNLAEVDVEAWNPFMQQDTPADNPATQMENEHKLDESDFFASYIESKWIEKLHLMANDPGLQKFFMLSEKDFSDFASELSTGAARLGLQEEMAEAFRKVAAYANTRKESIVRKQAAIAAQILNNYVNWLGFNPYSQKESQRTVQMPNGKSVVVFEPRVPDNGLPEIGDTRADWTRPWFGDWLNALAGLIMGNINYDGNQTFNVVENAALGTIIRNLSRTME